MSEVVYGSEIAKDIKENLKVKIDQLKAEGKRIPKLVVVLVGDNQASLSYVRGKEKACQFVGMENELITLPETTTQEELLSLIERLNLDTAVDGILVQLPLPAHIKEKDIIHAIDPNKDVDGFHPQSVGALCIGQPGFVSCTPAGIIELLKRSDIEIAGKECVVIGRSNIVGKPMGILLLRENGTVTIAHSRTQDLKAVAKRADILVVAVGKAKMITSEYVGMDRDENNKLCGDVDFEDVSQVAGAITPVPGGVGPMTIAMLMHNCLESVKLQGK